MAGDFSFTAEEMVVDQRRGYPRAYARLCRDKSVGPYSSGPPFTFTPYILQPHEASRAEELDQLFPVIDSNAEPTTNPKLFVNLLWKQLNHLGNAGFDPTIVRVDHYGNVICYHADSASPLAWDIDHWFPCSRGGLTVPSNLRILQRKVCKGKHNKLEFLVPWWDFQLGISINQFLSIFASSNSDFRFRAFSLLFFKGENEELNDSQTVELHRFPKHIEESQEEVGLAPASVVLSRKESQDASSVLKTQDFNRKLRRNSSIIGSSKQNETLDLVTNPYQAIVMTRDSLKKIEETTKMRVEIEKVDDEVNVLKRKNEEDKIAIQDLESVLIKRKRRVEKCRRLAESQSAYRIMLEKMIRDAMHQSVIYKEQVRLNQAANNALIARLEAQKAICDAAEKDLDKNLMKKGELDKQIKPELEQARKKSKKNDDTFCEERPCTSRPTTTIPRSRIDSLLLEARPRTPRLSMDNNISIEDRYKKDVLSIEQKKAKTHVHKELRVFLEEEQKVSEAEKQEGIAEEKHDESDTEEDEEIRKQRGKGNVEKWLQMLLENNTPEELEPQMGKINSIKKNKTNLKEKDLNEKENIRTDHNVMACEKNGSRSSFEELGSRRDKNGNERVFMRSPSVILGIKKGVNCITKKPLVQDD